MRRLFRAFGCFGLASTALNAAMMIAVPGCAAVVGSAVLMKTVGETIPAAYTPAKEDPILVLAENYQNPAASALEAEQLARYVCQNLERKQVAPLIDPSLWVDMRSQNPETFRKMTIAQVGKELGAKQVLYIAILSEGTDEAAGAEFQRGKASVRVRIVDVATGDTRWPVDASNGYPLSVQTPVTKITNAGEEAALKRSVQAKLGGDIARLFYKYKADEEGDKAFIENK